MGSTLEPQEMALRLLAAAVIGIALGINRDLRRKPTGMRTLSLVALGASLATIATVYLPEIQHDPNALSRVVQGILQGVLTGVAFLGAGAIIRSNKPDETPGLTTAANVFVTASLGIACGLGQWWVALFGAAIALALLALAPLEHRLESLSDARKLAPGNAGVSKPGAADMPGAPGHPEGAGEDKHT